MCLGVCCQLSVRLNFKIKSLLSLFFRFPHPSLHPQRCISFPTLPTRSSFACSVWRSALGRSCTRTRRTQFNPSHSLAASAQLISLPPGNGTKEPVVVVVLFTFKIQNKKILCRCFRQCFFNIQLQGDLDIHRFIFTSILNCYPNFNISYLKRRISRNK